MIQHSYACERTVDLLALQVLLLGLQRRDELTHTRPESTRGPQRELGSV
jgi:hypothetical protein